MKYKIMLLVGLCVIIVSCKKITNVKIADSASTGKLSYQVLDDSGKGLPGVKVSVYNTEENSSGIYYEPSKVVDTLRTNADGIASFLSLFPANYLIVTDSPAVNKVKYNTREFAQVVAGLDKKKVVKASDHSGYLKVTLMSSQDYATPLKNMGIAAVPYPMVMTSRDIRGVLDAALISGITNENGFAAIKIPANIRYMLIVYSLNKGVISYLNDYYEVVKDGSYQVRLYTSPVYQ